MLLAAMWLGYFLLHSWLASLRVKRWVACRLPRLAPAYRLFYNLVALAALVPPVYFAFALGGEPVLRWQGPWRWLADLAALAAAVGFLASLRWYDGLTFLGLRQLAEGRMDDGGRLRISPLHRWVRHPWYFFGLILLWTRDLTPAFLVSAVMATLYLIVGSRLEERKLRQEHGEAYARYCERVPPLLPLPWKRLDADEAARLEARAGCDRPRPGGPSKRAQR